MHTEKRDIILSSWGKAENQLNKDWTFWYVAASALCFKEDGDTVGDVKVK